MEKEFEKDGNGRTGAIVIDGIKVMECSYGSIDD